MLLARLFPRRDSRSPNRSLGLVQRPATHHRPTRRPHLEPLEERSLLTTSFGSALSIGNGVGHSQAFDVAADAAGNSFVTGYFSGTVDFDPAATHPGNTDILTARGTNDVFVAKYAADGSLAWVQRMGGDATPSSLTDTGRKITVDGSGSVYVVGDFTGSSADFGSTTLTTLGDKDGFVAKLDAGGTVQWATRWGTTARDEGNGVGVDSSGNVYVLGERVGAGINSAQPAVDYDVLKFSPTGAGVWSKSINAQGLGTAAGFAVDGAGNVFVGGGFTGTVDFDPSSKTHYVSVTNTLPGSPSAGFVLRLNTDGKFGWVSPFLSQRGNSTVQSLALDGSGNVIAGGYYGGTVDFDPGSGTTNLTSGGGFITKLNGSGGLVWARALEGGSVSVFGLTTDASGVYATGAFKSIDLDPGAGVQSRTASGLGDIFVVKLTTAGNFSWGESFGGTGNDVGFAVAVDPTGTVHLAGFYEGTVDFDPDPLATYYLTNPGTFRNAFLVRLRQM